MLELPTVTLFCIDTRSPALARRSLMKSQRHVRFASTVFLGPRDIEPLNSLLEYSEFMLKELADYIDTPHVLVTQWDGYVCNPAAWSPAFLQYDYIGAPWPSGEIGNGGFSLRSSKLLQATRAPDVSLTGNEDSVICTTHRALLESRGIRFAPLDTARRFSFEMDYGPIFKGQQPFGFHGLYNLPFFESEADLIALMRLIPDDIASTAACLSLLKHTFELSAKTPAKKWAAVRAIGERILAATDNPEAREILDRSSL